MTTWRLWLTVCLTLGLIITWQLPAAWAEGEMIDDDAPADSDNPLGAEDEDVDLTALAKAAAPSLVVVEYSLQYDKGQAPNILGTTAAERLIDEERPLEVSGFLISPQRLISADPQIHPRFVKSIHVRHGQSLSRAEIVAWSHDQSALYLELERPLAGAKPLDFDAELEGPYFLVGHGQADAIWSTSVRGLSRTLIRTSDGREFLQPGTRGIAMTAAGKPVGLVMTSELPADGSWKGSPLNWQQVTREQRAKAIEALKPAHESTVVPVTVRFRSPSLHGRTRFTISSRNTEQHYAGVIVAPDKVLVLANLKPNITAHLEQVTLNMPDGRMIGAKFARTLKDYGAFVVTPEQPLEQTMTFADTPVAQLLNQFMLTADVTIQGEKAQVFYNHDRVASLVLGWRRQIYPRLRGADGMIVYNMKGETAAIPVARRERVSITREEDFSPMRLTSVNYIEQVLKNLSQHSDPHNVPKGELEAERLAWLGVEMQPLNTELARANDVSELTNDGATGALVTHVYDNSPAADAGLKSGDILLRLHLADYPQPLDVVADPPILNRPFPWQALDRARVEQFEELPTPWLPRETSFTRALTDLGIGTKYAMEYVTGGEVQRKEFTITLAPRDYRSAVRHKSDAIGLTVRNLTYESRRYFQKTDDDPGVIISAVEAGSKADTAELKPYEIITSVNDKPVHSVQEFEQAIQGQSDLSLNVTRFNRDFVRKITGLPTGSP